MSVTVRQSIKNWIKTEAHRKVYCFNNLMKLLTKRIQNFPVRNYVNSRIKNTILKHFPSHSHLIVIHIGKMIAEAKLRTDIQILIEMNEK